MGTFKNIRRQLFLTCRDVTEFLTAYSEGDLEEGTRRRFESHVSSCLACAAYLDQYRKTVELVKETGRTDTAVEPPEKLVELTLAFLREHYDEKDEGKESSTEP